MVLFSITEGMGLESLNWGLLKKLEKSKIRID
jgi:hypothetical protein